jgi:hypothetical protein
MVDFDDQIAEWVESTQTTIDEALQTIAIKVGTNLVHLSPVDTGRFKGNWQLSVGEMTGNSLIRYDQEGYSTIAEMATNARTFTAGQIAYIQNHVLYGYDLEYGSSKQAPDGMVGITELQFQRIVDEAVRLVK